MPMHRPRWRTLVCGVATLVSAWIGVSGLSVPALAAQEKVKASSSSNSGNVVRRPAPGVAPRNQLVIFIPGTGLRPSQSTEFLDYAAGLGFHVIGVAYPNSKSVATICAKEGDLCFGQVREEIVSGRPTSSKVSIDQEASILGRARAQVRLLATSAPADGWNRYLTGEERRLLFGDLVVIGHSQGAGHAAMVGIKFPVARVGMFSGPNDIVRDTGSVPSWTRANRVTPSGQWRALSHREDSGLPEHTTSWNNFAMSAASRQTIGGKTANPHQSVVVDAFLLSGVSGRWRTLLGA